MQKPTLAACWIALALALAGCDLDLIVDAKLDSDAASFAPSPLTVGVGRSASLTLRLSDPTIDEVNLRYPADGLTLSGISCDPASSCTLEEQELVGIDQHARLAVRLPKAITMQVTGVSSGRSYVSTNLLRHESCDVSFLGGCTPAAESFASVTVQVVP